VLGVLFILP